MIEAKYWTQADDGQAVCRLCPHRCRIAEGGTGRCRVRGVRGGRLMAVGYGCLSSVHSDPIEKKPLYHFHPGSSIFSVGGWGCNFHCEFCQNWSISQQFLAAREPIGPETVVAQAGQGRDIGIAYTYNEPLIGIEFVLDCAAMARDRGLVNVLVTNGYVNEDPASALLELIDAVNIDIKSMDEAFYAHTCGGHLKPVLDFAEQAGQKGCHVEITNLLVPDANDDEALIRDLAKWVAGSLGRHTPIHLSAYRPEYKATSPPTPASTLVRAHELCREHLDHVYIGNVMTEEGRHTQCPACGHVLIKRAGYRTEVTGLTAQAHCVGCGLAMNPSLRPHPLQAQDERDADP